MRRKMRIVLIVGCIFLGLIICVVMYGLLGKNRLTAQTYDDQNVGEIYFEPTEEEQRLFDMPFYQYKARCLMNDLALWLTKY